MHASGQSAHMLSILSGDIFNQYVEWDGNIFDDQSDDAGEAIYTMETVGDSFQLQARAPSSQYTLQALLDGITTANNPEGSTINLGWRHDTVTPFILSGEAGNFWSNNPPSDWMHASLDQLGTWPIRHICMPGSHDAGMSVITTSTSSFITSDNTITQLAGIDQRLALGSRYFDIRPAIVNGQFYTGHYSNIDVLGWQGGSGQSIDQIIQQINSFTAYNKELIILNLSHDYNGDAGFRNFNQTEWNSLLQKLTSINDLFVVNDPSAVDISTYTLNQFIGNGDAAVVVVFAPGGSATLGQYANRGFFYNSQFNVYNSYSDTDDLQTMETDQINKLRQQRTSPDSPLFLLSWTLTEAWEDIVTGSIINLAQEADPRISQVVWPAISAQSYPNILYVDAFNSQITALAIAINWMVDLGL